MSLCKRGGAYNVSIVEVTNTEYIMLVKYSAKN